MLELIKTRRSVRAFRPDPIAGQDILDLLEAGMHAPSAGNEQAWQFVVLDAARLAEYVALNPNTPKGAPHAILVCGDRKKEKYAGFHLHDCCAATQNILLAAHTKQLGAVWTEVFKDKRDKVRELLNLPGHIEPVACIPFGRPAGPLPTVPTRYDEKNVHWNQW